MRCKSIIGIATTIQLSLCVSGAAMAACEPAETPGIMRFLVAENGDTAPSRITGRTTFGDIHAFLEGFEEGPNTVILDFEGLNAGRSMGPATRVGDTQDCSGGVHVGRGLCASSCAYAFLGGDTRDRNRGDDATTIAALS